MIAEHLILICWHCMVVDLFQFHHKCMRITLLAQLARHWWVIRPDTETARVHPRGVRRGWGQGAQGPYPTWKFLLTGTKEPVNSNASVWCLHTQYAIYLQMDYFFLCVCERGETDWERFVNWHGLFNPSFPPQFTESLPLLPLLWRQWSKGHPHCHSRI